MLKLGGLLVKFGIKIKELDHLKVDVIGFRLLVHRGEAEEPLIGQTAVFLPRDTFLKQAAPRFRKFDRILNVQGLMRYLS